ncbi:glycine cleavage system protein T, partial [bacterium]|nr:glycine cleavage system protein T [bacterium]
ELSGKRIPRELYPITKNGTVVGKVTSGTFSPTFNKSIAMAYVPATLSAIGTDLDVDIRGKSEPCKVVPLPFYKRKTT